MAEIPEQMLGLLIVMRVAELSATVMLVVSQLQTMAESSIVLPRVMFTGRSGGLRECRCLSGGKNSNEVRNSYAAGTVLSSGTSLDRAGGLIGYMINESKLINSYTISNVAIQAGGVGVGALVGWHQGGDTASSVARDIMNSYWDSDRNIAGHNNSSSGNNGQTTMQLQNTDCPRHDSNGSLLRLERRQLGFRHQYAIPDTQICSKPQPRWPR